MRDQASESLKNKTCNMMIRILTLTGCILVCLATFHKASAQTRQSVTPGISAASVHGIQTTVPGTTAAGTGFPYTGLQEPYPGFRPGFDNDIKQMRNNIAPGLRYHLDNYTQYLPAAVMVGLKTFGYKGRTSWGRMLVSDAFSGAIMAGLVNGLKYTVRRPRPDGTARNSFPSGHTATAFMTAAMLHKEYGWRSPWFSIGGYAAAAFTGVSRVLNDRHYLTDVMAGAAIGISSVHLGYFLADLIFKDEYLTDGYETPDMFGFDPEHRYYEAGLFFARRFVIGDRADRDSGLLPFRGSTSGIDVHIPLIPGTGLAIRSSVNELSFRGGLESEAYEDGVSIKTYSMNMYNVLAGAYWVYPFPRVIEFNLKAMLGYAWHRLGNGIDAAAEAALAVRAGENFRIKAFAGYETFSLSRQKPFVNSFMLGLSSAVCW